MVVLLLSMLQQDVIGKNVMYLIAFDRGCLDPQCLIIGNIIGCVVILLLLKNQHAWFQCCAYHSTCLSWFAYKKRGPCHSSAACILSYNPCLLDPYLSCKKITTLTSLHSPFSALIFSPPPLHCQRRHSFFLLLVPSGFLTMSTQTSPQRNRCTCCLGDPYYTAMRLIATVAEFACLREEEFWVQLFLTAFCSQWHYHRIMHLKEYFCQWLGALLVVRPGWCLATQLPCWVVMKLPLNQSGSIINMFSPSTAIWLLACILDEKATPNLPKTYHSNADVTTEATLALLCCTLLLLSASSQIFSWRVILRLSCTCKEPHPSC